MNSQSEFLDNQNQFQSEEIYKSPKKQVNYESSINSGPWNETENRKYAIFIEKNREILQSRTKRRDRKVFKELSLFIGTRNAIQCRSYHQKQLSKFRNIQKILDVFKKDFVQGQKLKKVEKLASVPLNEVDFKQKKPKGDLTASIQFITDAEVQSQLAGINLPLSVQENLQKKKMYQLLQNFYIINYISAIYRNNMVAYW